jgi:hypothetical protein
MKKRGEERLNKLQQIIMDRISEGDKQMLILSKLKLYSLFRNNFTFYK